MESIAFFSSKSSMASHVLGWLSIFIRRICHLGHFVIIHGNTSGFLSSRKPGISDVFFCDFTGDISIYLNEDGITS